MCAEGPEPPVMGWVSGNSQLLERGLQAPWPGFPSPAGEPTNVYPSMVGQVRRGGHLG